MIGLNRMREEDILYQNGNYWVCKAKVGYEVYKDKITHAVRCGIFGSEGEHWFKRAVHECNRRSIENL